MTSLQLARRFVRNMRSAWFVLAGLLAGCGTTTPPAAIGSAGIEPLVLEPILATRRTFRSMPANATPAQPLYRPAPVYPPILRSRKIEGDAKVAFVLMEDGTPTDVECVQATDRRFGEAAVEAVKKWRYQPAVWEGKPVAINMEVPIVFTLDPSKPASRGNPIPPPRIELPSTPALTGDPQRDYERLQALQASQPPPEFARGSDGYFTWLQERRRKLYDLGMEYISRYGTDARRWEVLLLLQYGRNHYVEVLRDGTKQLAPDKTERDAWERKYFPWLEELLASNDASKRARADALRQLIDHSALSVRRGDAESETTIPKVLAWMDRYERENPNSGSFSSLYRTVAMMLNVVGPPRSIQFLNEKWAAHSADDFSDVDIRKQLDRFLRFFAGQEKPVDALWQQLKALDPGLIEASAYRGKVVLIASLAVDWSSRTMELEELYRNHRDAGLEIVQVAYYNANRTAPPEQRDKAAMQRYVAAKRWPWRVVWDPKDRPQESFSEHWGQNSIPAFFVISRDGCIAQARAGRLTLEQQITDELARQPP